MLKSDDIESVRTCIADSFAWAWCRLWVVCHEHRRSKRRCATVREMKEGPSRPEVRFWSQATASCCRQKRWWWTLRKRRDKIPTDTIERGERKRTAVEVSKSD